MRILQLCKKFPYPAKDGEAIAILNLTKAFAETGQDVTVLAINTNKHYFDLRELPEEVRCLGKFHSVDVNTDISWWKAFLNLFSSESYNIQRFSSIKYKAKLIQVLSEQAFDIVHLEGLYLLPYLDVIRRYSKAPVSLRAHNVEHEIWQRLAHNQSGGPKKWYLKLLASRMQKYEQSILNEIDVIVPISQRDCDAFVKMGLNKPSYVLPAGISRQFSANGFEKEQDVSVFFIGGLDWLPNREGVQWFLDNVWPHITEKFPEIRFRIAGRNIPPDFYNLQLPNVDILGEVENARKFMLDNTIMIVPLFSGSGMRIKILEAMALSRAVISTALGAEGIDYRDDRDLLIAGDANDFVHKISLCIEQPEVRESLGRSGNQLIKNNYDNTTLARGLLEFYQSILN